MFARTKAKPTTLRTEHQTNRFRSLRRGFASTPILTRVVAPVQSLTTWDLGRFRAEAFVKDVPAKLFRSKEQIPPACTKWFVHESLDASNSIKATHFECVRTSELDSSFWFEHSDLIVPLEFTTRTRQEGEENENGPEVFHCSEAPLSILLSYLEKSASKRPLASMPEALLSSDADIGGERYSIYLAQCSLASLPLSLRADIPTPDLVQHAGRGDIYSSSLWLGRAPTYTPLHRDPNPNLFLQLAGEKVVRLFPPEVGEAVFDHAQEQLVALVRKTKDEGIYGNGHGRSIMSGSAAFRGEEMMAGPEKELLHQLVWGDDNAYNNLDGLQGRYRDGDEQQMNILAYASEARLRLGEALFIPKGWWHSVRGVGEGVTASVNWWFR